MPHSKPVLIVGSCRDALFVKRYKSSWLVYVLSLLLRSSVTTVYPGVGFME
jgi:hypothetical protein